VGIASPRSSGERNLAGPATRRIGLVADRVRETRRPVYVARRIDGDH
jgi:hypothetical protein